jgi:hypothetical protein
MSKIPVDNILVRTLPKALFALAFLGFIIFLATIIILGWEFKYFFTLIISSLFSFAFGFFLRNFLSN